MSFGRFDNYSATATMPYGLGYKCRKCGAINTEIRNIEYKTETIHGGRHDSDSDLRAKVEEMARIGVTDRYKKLSDLVNSDDAFTSGPVPRLGEGVCKQCGCCQPWGTMNTEARQPKIYSILLKIFKAFTFINLFCGWIWGSAGGFGGMVFFLIVTIFFAIALCTVGDFRKKNLASLWSESRNAIQYMKDNHEEACLPRISNGMDGDSTDERILALNGLYLSTTKITIKVNAWDEVDVD